MLNIQLRKKKEGFLGSTVSGDKDRNVLCSTFSQTTSICCYCQKTPHCSCKNTTTTNFVSATFHATNMIFHWPHVPEHFQNLISAAAWFRSLHHQRLNLYCNRHIQQRSGISDNNNQKQSSNCTLHRNSHVYVIKQWKPLNLQDLFLFHIQQNGSMIFQNTLPCERWQSHSGTEKDSSLLGCYSVSSGEQLPPSVTFYQLKSATMQKACICFLLILKQNRQSTSYSKNKGKILVDPQSRGQSKLSLLWLHVPDNPKLLYHNQVPQKQV